MKPARKPSFAAALESAVSRGFEAQCERAGEALREKRLGDPWVAFLLETFDRQTRDRGQRAQAAQVAGDHRAAKGLAESAMAAAENARRVREACGF